MSRSKGFALLLAALLLAGGLGIASSGAVAAPPAVPAPTQGSPLNLGILWHMHQPLYKNILTGEYEMPWVRDHTPEEYLDHPKILMEYPMVNVTFNLVPSLILQIEDYVVGAVDNHVQLARIDLTTATAEERDMMAQEFIRLAPWHYTRNTSRGIENPWYDTYAAWPRMNFLVNKIRDQSADSLSDTELQDLETIFFLHQISIPYIEGQYDPADRNDTIIQLLQKGTEYTQADTETVLAIQRDTMAKVVGFYKQAQDRGQAEVVTTPFYHPIVPLLMDAVVPSEDAAHNISKGGWAKDAAYQYENATAFYQTRFGVSAKGVWHSEQSVSPEAIAAAVDAGFMWTSTDEGVLWKSEVSGRLVGRPTDQEELLNRSRAYAVTTPNGTMDIVFRDTDLSNRVSFTYGGFATENATKDFMDLLRSYHDNMTAAERGSRLVTLAADGENWMFLAGYPNDGRDFLNALYENLTAAQAAGWLMTWKIGDFLAQPGLTKTSLSRLHAGSWIDADFRTWTGEEEEQVGWARLVRARQAVVDYTIATEGTDFVGPSSSSTVKRAWEAIFTAEGSDWFWWYGDDQSSGDDGKFDIMFKAHLITAYTTIGLAPPSDLTVRWGPNATAQQRGVVTEESLPPTIDGVASLGEWDNATAWTQVVSGGLMRLRGLYAFADAAFLYVRIDLNGDATALRGTTGQDAELYFSYPIREAEADMEVNLNRYGVNYATKNGDYTFAWAARFRLRVVFAQSLSNGVTPWSLFTAGEAPDFLGDGTWSNKPPGMDDGVAVGSVIELLVPLSGALGMGPGDRFRLVAVTSESGTDVDILPLAAEGPGEVTVLIPRAAPPIAIFQDEIGDDRGDGDYTYATSGDFRCGDGGHCEDLLYDLTFFNISDAPTSVTFTFGFVDVGMNPWGGPNGFAYQIVEVYIDTDRVPGSGHRRMRDGPNADVTAEFAWEVVVQAAGWNSEGRTFVAREPSSTAPIFQSGVIARRIVGTNDIQLTLPKALLPSGDLKSWGFVVVAGAQDGFGPGKWRPIAVSAVTWSGGGAGKTGVTPGFHPRIYDAILPAGTDQASILAGYTSATVTQVPGVTIEVKAPGAPAVTVDSQPPWDKGDAVTVNWIAQPNPETQRPIVSYDVAILYATNDPVIPPLDDTTLTQTTFTVTIEQNITIRVTAFDGLATSLPFVTEYEVRKSPPPPSVNRAPVLTNPAVEPEEGDDRTPFLFSVRYLDPDNDAPVVTLVLGGSRTPMSYVGGGNATGSVFRVALTQPAGTHAFKFSADDGNGSANSIVETQELTLVVRSAGLPIAVYVGIGVGAIAAAAAIAYVFVRARRAKPPGPEPPDKKEGE